ncbi:MAG: hypothetical protein JXC32_11135 [Anaerolineae bacterium]|nr:hypothetical protein [Anaerolineae bacterium]
MAEQITCEPLEALNDALCHEEEARLFYQRASERTQDPSGAKMFADLADTAAAHIEILEKQVDTLTNEERWDLPECVFSCEADVEAPLFPRGREALEQTIRENTDDTEAVLFALETVNNTFELYRKHAMTSEDPMARQLYQYLADQARTQRDLLMLTFERSSPRAGWAA